jgi:hypothetical protein
MEKNILSYFVWLAVVVVVAIILFWFFGLRLTPGVSSSADGGATGMMGTTSTMDSVASTPLGDEQMGGEQMQMVLNNAAHYRVAVPVSWYVEKNGVAGVTLYPDYDPKATSTSLAAAAPSCKIEISALSNKSNLALGDWLSAYLRQDPTEDVTETSQSPLDFGQVSGGDVITWAGALNGVSTTLTYVLGDGLVYEFAPSGISGIGDCHDSLAIVLKNFTITTQ